MRLQRLRQVIVGNVAEFEAVIDTAEAIVGLEEHAVAQMHAGVRSSVIVAISRFSVLVSGFGVVSVSSIQPDNVSGGFRRFQDVSGRFRVGD